MASDCACQLGNLADGDPTLITLVGADHTEGMLTETDRYRDELVGFFEESLG